MRTGKDQTRETSAGSRDGVLAQTVSTIWQYIALIDIRHYVLLLIDIRYVLFDTHWEIHALHLLLHDLSHCCYTSHIQQCRSHLKWFLLKKTLLHMLWSSHRITHTMYMSFESSHIHCVTHLEQLTQQMYHCCSCRWLDTKCAPDGACMMVMVSSPQCHHAYFKYLEYVSDTKSWRLLQVLQAASTIVTPVTEKLGESNSTSTALHVA